MCVWKDKKVFMVEKNYKYPVFVFIIFLHVCSNLSVLPSSWKHFSKQFTMNKMACSLMDIAEKVVLQIPFICMAYSLCHTLADSASSEQWSFTNQGPVVQS